MHHFSYHHNVLCAEQTNLAQLAADVGTPFYAYSTATLVRHYQVIDQSLAALPHVVCYSMKANSNQAVLATLAQWGSGADVVSGGELARALRAGVPAHKIVFSGVGKTPYEIAQALKAGILQFNVESEPELHAINTVAESMGVSAPIALRVNPDVDSESFSEKINTGKADTKFGIPLTDAKKIYAHAASMKNIKIVGVDMHIGSQILSLDPFRAAYQRLRDFVLALRADGHQLTYIDLGGGLGVPYEELHAPYENATANTPQPADLGKLVHEYFGDLGCTMIVEPGRAIVANAGVLVTQVMYIKKTAHKNFIIVDAAMNDLIRPTLYEAYHEIWPVMKNDAAQKNLADVVGPVCETGDFLAQDRMMPDVQAGDFLAVMSAGAYGAVMAGTYNTRPLVPEVMVKGGDWAIIRPRQTVDALIGLDRMPGWLDQG